MSKPGLKLWSVDADAYVLVPILAAIGRFLVNRHAGKREPFVKLHYMKGSYDR